MASKTLLLFALFTVLFIVSGVAATSEKQSDTMKPQSEEIVQPDQAYGPGGGSNGPVTYGPGGGSAPRGYCRYGCCGYRSYGSCSRCCSYVGEAVQTQPGH